MLTITVDDVMSTDYATIPKSTNYNEIRHLLAGEQSRVLFVLDDEQRLYGCLTSTDFIAGALDAEEGHTSAGDIAHPSETVIVPHASLARALKLMSAQNADSLPVVDDPRERRVVGVVYHKDLVLAHNRALREARAEERGET